MFVFVLCVVYRVRSGFVVVVLVSLNATQPPPARLAIAGWVRLFVISEKKFVSRVVFVAQHVYGDYQQQTLFERSGYEEGKVR